ncbi:MAG: hypothetical protein U5N55_03400 [Cypionkella sp.]|nr:hypothetical protein [Cypionkella sp.]
MKQGFSEVLLSLYRNLGSNLPWAGFLRDLASHSGAEAAHLVLHQEAGGSAHFGAGPLPIGADHMQRMRYLRAYSPDDFPAAMPFRALRTRVGSNGEAWIILSRSGGDLSASVSVLLGDLAPHLAQAAAQFWMHQHSLTARAAMQDLARRVGIGWAVLSAQGEVLAVHNAPPAYVVADRLRLPPAVQKRLMMSLETGSNLALNLTDMQALLVPLSISRAAAILYFMGRNTPSAGDETLLRDLFDLTRTEARFAARIAGGDSIAQAGEALNFTLQTARYYSKQLYAKLGAAGLPEAIRILENSVYRLG